MAGKKIIQNERDLIKKSVEYLDQFIDDVPSTNNSRFPTLVIGMGEKNDEVLYEIRKSLDFNWSNAMHLEFLSMQYGEGGQWTSKRFRSQAEFETEQDKNGEDEVNRNEWVNEGNPFYDEIVSAQYRMLEKRDIFSTTGSIKLDFILDATDEHADDFYEYFKSFQFKSNHMQYKTLYLLLSQKDLDNSLAKSERMLQKVLHDPGIADCCVYLLSDELSDGSSLSKEELKINYRLIADLIFLGGDRTNQSEGLPVLNNGVKLASYTVFSKPSDQIGEVTIGHLINKIYSEEEKRFSIEKMEQEEVKNRLEISKDGRIRVVEIEWENFRKTLPSVSQNPIEYFPYAEKNGLSIAMHEAKRNIESGFAELNRMTFGISGAYIKKHYQAAIGNYFEENDIKNRVYSYIKKRFNYFELLKLKPIINDLENMLKHERQVQLAGNTLDEVFQRYGEQVARQQFYSIFIDIYCESLKKLISSAENFHANYNNICKQVEIARSINGEEEKAIEDYYGHQVSDYILKVRGNNSEIIFGEFFDVDLDRNHMIQRIFEIYTKMLDEVEVYKYDFEQELLAHMDDKTPSQLTEFINNHFSAETERNLRLHAVGQIRTQLVRLSEYYLLNKQAAYYKHLKDAEDFKSGKYNLIELRRSDCIEQLAVYGIKEDNQITIDGRKQYEEETTPATVTEASTGVVSATVADKVDSFAAAERESATTYVPPISPADTITPEVQSTPNNSVKTEEELLMDEFDAL